MVRSTIFNYVVSNRLPKLASMAQHKTILDTHSISVQTKIEKDFFI